MFDESDSDTGTIYLPRSSDTDDSDISEIYPMLSSKPVLKRQNAFHLKATDNKELFIKQICSSEASAKTGLQKKHVRVHNKRQYCLYCEQSFSKISSHLLNCHMMEEEVKKLFETKGEIGDTDMEKKRKEKERKDRFELLRNKGNFIHNERVLREGVGELILVRRPTKNFDVSEYGPCSYCLGYFKKSDLGKHQTNHCHFRHGKSKPRYAILQSEILMGQHSEASKHLREVYATMKNDQIKHVATSDSLIVGLGNSWANKTRGNKARNKNYVSQKMRETARYLLNLQKVGDSSGDMSSFITPAKFDICVKAAVMTAGELSNDSLERPSVAIKIGHNLVKMAMIKRSMAMKDRKPNEEAIVEAERFLLVKEGEWYEKVTSMALGNLATRKFNSAQRLPRSEDLKKMSDYLKASIKVPVASCSFEEYRELQTNVLARLLTFNRRRPGELEQML